MALRSPELFRPERLLPSLLPLQDRLSRRRRRRAPVVPPTAILLDVWVSRQEGARLVLRPVPATSPAKSPRVAGSAESPRRVNFAQDDTDDEQNLIPAEPSPEAKSRGSEQPKTPPKGSRPPPKLPSDSAAWKPSLRGGETADRSESAQRPSKPNAAGLTLPRRRRASRSPLRWSALPLSSGAGGTSQGLERTSRRTCVSKPPLPRCSAGPGEGG